MLCLSSVYFSYSDLPFRTGRISIEKGGLAPLPWLRFKHYQNFKVYNFVTKTIDSSTPDRLVHNEMTLMNNLDKNWPVSQKIMPIKIMTLEFAKGILQKEQVPLCFAQRNDKLTDSVDGLTSLVTYQSDKTNDFVLGKIDSKDKIPEQCLKQGHHIIFKTMTDKYRFCDVCCTSFDIDTKSITDRISQITCNLPQ